MYVRGGRSSMLRRLGWLLIGRCRASSPLLRKSASFLMYALSVLVQGTLATTWSNVRCPKAGGTWSRMARSSIWQA